MTGEVAPDADCVAPPSLEVQVAAKFVIALPPVPFGAMVTIAELSPRATPVIPGAAGVVPARNALDATEAALSPMEFVATTAHVYVRPFDNDVTLSGEVVPVFERVVPPVLDVHVTL